MKLLLILMLIIYVCFIQSCSLHYQKVFNKCERLDNQRTQVLLYCKDSIQKFEMLHIIDSIMYEKCGDYLDYKRYLKDLEDIKNIKK